MKIVVKELEESFKKDDRDVLVIEINGKTEFEVYDGEPEDNCLARNFNDCYFIDDMLRRAFEAGKAGEELDIIYETADEL